MIRKFDFVKREATIESTDRKKTWIVKLGLVTVGDHLFDMGTLLQERRISVIHTSEDCEAARALIKSWPDFEEKDDLLEILDRKIDQWLRDYRCSLRSGLLDAYGSEVGPVIYRGYTSRKLEKHTKRLLVGSVVDLIKFLLTKTPMLAQLTFPAPKSELGAVRACQSHEFSRKYMSSLKKLVKGMKSFDIFTAFRVASYVEKVSQPRPRSNTDEAVTFNQSKKGSPQWGSR